MIINPYNVVDVIMSKIIYDNKNKRYLYFNPHEVEDTDYHPRKGQQKRRFVHMCKLFKVSQDLKLEFVHRENKFNVFQRLIEYEYREITQAEKARFLIRIDKKS